MAWYDEIIDWLTTTGVSLGIIFLIWIALHFLWKFVCNLAIKALIISTIKAREAVMRSKSKMGSHARSSSMAIASMGTSLIQRVKTKSVDNTSSPKVNSDDGGTTIITSNEDTMDDHENGIVQDDESKDDHDKKEDEEFENLKLSDAMRSAMESRARTIGQVLYSIGKFIILLIILIMILDTIGVSVAPIVTAAAIIGFALAQGATDVCGDFIGGMFILAENQYFHGELVNINGYTGSVEDFSLRVTKLRAKNGDLRIIPNGEIRELTNKSRVFSLAVVSVTIPYSNEDDYEKAEELLSDTVVPQMKDDEGIKKVLYSENVSVKAAILLEESIKIKTSVKVKIGFTDTVQQKIMKLIRTEFPKNEITIIGLEKGMAALIDDDDDEDDEGGDE